MPVLSAPILLFLLSIAIGAWSDGLEYLEPGPNYIRVCCNVVSVSAVQLVYDPSSNTTSTVPVLPDTPIAALTLNKFKLSKDAIGSVTGYTIGFGPDSKLEINKMYLVCMSVATSVNRKCVTFRPCECSPSTPWFTYRVTNTPPTDRAYIQLSTQPLFPNQQPPTPVSFTLSLWDGMTYRGCQSTGGAGGGCQPLVINPSQEGEQSYYWEKTLWPDSLDGSMRNVTDSLSYKDDQSLSTVAAELNVTVMVSVVGAGYEDVVLVTPGVTWNRNGYSTYSRDITYATPTITNNYATSFDHTDDPVSTCQKVITRRASDPIEDTSHYGTNPSTAGPSVAVTRNNGAGTSMTATPLAVAGLAVVSSVVALRTTAALTASASASRPTTRRSTIPPGPAIYSQQSSMGSGSTQSIRYTTSKGPEVGTVTSRGPAVGTTTSRSPAVGMVTSKGPAVGTTTSRSPAVGMVTSKGPTVRTMASRGPTVGATTSRSRAVGTVASMGIAVGAVTSRSPAMGTMASRDRVQRAEGSVMSTEATAQAVRGIPGTTPAAGGAVTPNKNAASTSAVMGATVAGLVGLQLALSKV